MSSIETSRKSIMDDVQIKLISDLTKKLEDFIIEGLKRKGFEFDNKTELENFIKTRCECKDDIDLKERIYSVDNIPFFLHRYEISIEPISEDNKGINISANYGTYSFL